MGHMDDVVDENEQKYTITVYRSATEAEVFHGCTEVEHNDESLEFIDKNGKGHELYGVDSYHIAEE